MDPISVGIGLLGFTGTALFKAISYIRGCDRSMASIQLQIKDHVIQSQKDLADIRSDIARLQTDMNGLMRYGDSDGSDH